mmetsp:Transcript_41861/g.111687  ORF Transcript_41861/g.111687 Transcript_41861/m.111687 type:complete len:239 (-) Transcript_41861:502-1218(-)
MSELDTAREKLLRHRHCRILSVGGGPGFEALGLQIFSEILGWEVCFEHHIVDAEAGWQISAEALDAVLSARSSPSADTQLHFHEGDALAATLPSGVPAPSEFQLLLFPYVLHENASGLQAANYGLLPGLFRGATSGALFVFTDSQDRLWPEVVDLAMAIGPFRMYLVLILAKYWLVLEKSSGETCNGDHPPERHSAQQQILEVIRSVAPKERSAALKQLLGKDYVAPGVLWGRLSPTR